MNSKSELYMNSLARSASKNEHIKSAIEYFRELIEKDLPEEQAKEKVLEKTGVVL